MNLYEIDKNILECFDIVTGEIKDEELLKQLNEDKQNKIENIACWIKNIKAETKALKEEKDSFDKRIKTNNNLVLRLENTLNNALNGEKFKTSKCSISYINSKSVVVDDDFIEWAEKNAPNLLNITVKENKTELKSRLEIMEVPHARIEEKSNIQVR